ncbi:MAG: anion permease [Peptococcaceae bacterium]|nr:anion permease [Peptococcaceae bacterium]
MSSEAKIKPSYWIHVIIGLLIMIGFPQLGPFAPITETGMWVAGILLGMVYLWSTIDNIWPSILGLLLFALYSGFLGSDVTGYNAVKTVFLNAIGGDIVITVILSMILFGAVEYAGCTKYLARFFLSRKIITGRPYVFLFILFFCAYFIAGFTIPVASLLILWPLTFEALATFGYTSKDKIYWISTFGIYFAAALGQPMFPFKGAALVITGVFSGAASTSVSYPGYIIYNLSFSIIMMFLFLLFVKFILRPDITKMKNVTPEQFTKIPLPPMNVQQKSVLIACLVFIILLLAPSFMPKDWTITQILNAYGTIGVLSMCIIVLMILRFNGKPMLSWRDIAKTSVSWDIIFIVAAAVYICNSVAQPQTGLKEFIIQVMTPILGNKPAFVFVGILLLAALITANFANNAGMASILIPIALAFQDMYPNVPMTAVCMSICMIVFVTGATPAGSPYAAMLHGQKDKISFKQIELCAIPMCLVAWILYTFLGYPFSSFIFSLL